MLYYLMLSDPLFNFALFNDALLTPLFDVKLC